MGDGTPGPAAGNGRSGASRHVRRGWAPSRRSRCSQVLKRHEDKSSSAKGSGQHLLYMAVLKPGAPGPVWSFALCFLVLEPLSGNPKIMQSQPDSYACIIYKILKEVSGGSFQGYGSNCGWVWLGACEELRVQKEKNRITELL